MRLVLSLLVLIALVRPAYADLDYRCLATCTQNRTPGTTCIQQCKYQNLPSSGPAIQGMNYQCRDQCLKSGYAYGYCEQQCVPPAQ